MSDSSITAHLSGLPERGKEPHSASVLTRWVDVEEKANGVAGGQLRWLIASKGRQTAAGRMKQCAETLER